MAKNVKIPNALQFTANGSNISQSVDPQAKQSGDDYAIQYTCDNYKDGSNKVLSQMGARTSKVSVEDDQGANGESRIYYGSFIQAGAGVPTVVNSIGVEVANVNGEARYRTWAPAADTITNLGELSKDMENQIVTVKNLRELILSNLYPVGSIYMNAQYPDNPAVLLGFGVWEQIGEGNVLLAGSQNGSYRAGSSYGEKTRSVPLKEHNHSASFTGQYAKVDNNVWDVEKNRDITTQQQLHDHLQPTGGFEVSQRTNNFTKNSAGNTFIAATVLEYTPRGSVSVGNTGDTDPKIDVMQPSIAVYMWKRVG